MLPLTNWQSQGNNCEVENKWGEGGATNYNRADFQVKPNMIGWKSKVPKFHTKLGFHHETCVFIMHEIGWELQSLNDLIGGESGR